MESSIQFVVNERLYTLVPMAPRRAIHFAPKALGVIARLVDGSPILTGLPDYGDNVEDALKSIIPELIRIAAQIDPEAMSGLIDEVFTTDIYTEADGNLSDTEIFDNHFSLFPSDLLQVGFWAVVHNSLMFLVEDHMSLLIADENVKETLN